MNVRTLFEIEIGQIKLKEFQWQITNTIAVTQQTKYVLVKSVFSVSAKWNCIKMVEHLDWTSVLNLNLKYD